MLGTIINTITILAGSAFGALVRTGIGEKYKKVLFDGLGLQSSTLQDELTDSMRTSMLSRVGKIMVFKDSLRVACSIASARSLLWALCFRHFLLQQVGRGSSRQTLSFIRMRRSTSLVLPYLLPRMAG